jgi:hypothetical protein
MPLASPPRSSSLRPRDTPFDSRRAHQPHCGRWLPGAQAAVAAYAARLQNAGGACLRPGSAPSAAIVRLFGRYASIIDWLDFDRVPQVLTADAQFDFGPMFRGGWHQIIRARTVANLSNRPEIGARPCP